MSFSKQPTFQCAPIFLAITAKILFVHTSTACKISIFCLSKGDTLMARKIMSMNRIKFMVMFTYETMNIPALIEVSFYM